jgi:hypothetical protein
METRMKKTIFFFAILFLFFCIENTSGAERLLMSYQGMDAILYHLSCEQNGVAQLEIRSSTPEIFDGDRVEVQRLIAQARAVLSFDCPSISRITARGMVNSQLYFSGATEKNWNWKIIGLYAPPKSG